MSQTDPYLGRYCKDCRWFIEHRDVCSHPATAFDAILGLIERHEPDARFMRADPESCGPQGQWWSPQDPTLAEEP